MFFKALEPYILDGDIAAVPPNVLKDLITFYASSGWATRLEEMICRLSTDTMDINQVTTLCQQYNLYDALIYVWTRAIGDYITPLINILSLVKVLDFDADESENIYMASAMKVFPYLAYTLTGRVYPSGTFMDDTQAHNAKKDVYRFLFSGGNLEWPPKSGTLFLTQTDKGKEPEFPYLRLMLEFDASSFMSMLNEAFEDSFLNEDEQDFINGHRSNGTRHGSALTPTRQFIINSLLGIMTVENFDPEDIIYFYMFIARNLPKYPQHIILPGTSLHQILVGLCNYPTAVLKDDCQLSVEYLLSTYHPSNPQSLIALFEKAEFHRVLKSVYRGTQQYAKLLETYLNDSENQEEVFDCIRDYLRSGAGLPGKQMNEIKTVIVSRARDLAAVNAARTAQTLNQYAPGLLNKVLEALEDGSDVQFQYLEALVEPRTSITMRSRSLGEGLPTGFTERYVQLMCKYNSTHVADFVSLLDSGDLKLDPVLPALEKSGIIDAAVVLLARDGLVRRAMDRLVKHLSTLEVALTGLIKAATESPDIANTEEALEDILQDVQKYIKVGIWLCQGQTRSIESTKSSPARLKKAYGEIQEEDLALDELLWLDLVDTVVALTKSASGAISDLETDALSVSKAPSKVIDTTRITTSLRSAVQQTFSALLASTTRPPTEKQTLAMSEPSFTIRSSSASQKTQPQTNPSFLRILRTFLTRASKSSPSLSDLRSVLAEIFSAYTFEETILSLANRFLDKEGFERVEEVADLRQRGWRPRGQVCEGCRKRAWGPGTGGAIWESWETRESECHRRRLEMDADENGKGKGKSLHQGDTDAERGSINADALIVFACRHLWHKLCLEKASPSEETSSSEARRGPAGRLRCPFCA